MQINMLISAVNANPEALLEKMRPECDAVLVNQCNTNGEEAISVNNCRIRVFHRNERGVGKSRNLAMEKAAGDIWLFCDDDIEYAPGYCEGILKKFREHPEADMIIFNLEVCPERRTYWNEGFRKIHWYNRGRYGACSVAVRRESLMRTGVRFSELFGGGAKYSNGEDSLFLKECAAAGLKMYADDFVIGKEAAGESTWFHGYTEKFFFDRGVLFAFLYGAFARLWAIRFVLTKKNMFQGAIKRKQAYKLMCQGICQGKKEKNQK